MLEVRDKYLPIGTIVLLDGGKRLVMIFGFCSTENGGEKVYDYSGCLYPDGLISSNEVLLFNHDQIVRVYHYGYENEEEKAYKQRLNEVMSEGTHEL